MKKINILLLALLLGFFVSCEKDEEQEKDEAKIYSFTGKVQKGPFITGTTITLNELNTNLSQTGKSFTTTISADDGSFSLNNVELSSDLVQITANGFYFSEIFGRLSEASLSLSAISSLTAKENVNINVMTHFIKARVEKLVSEGKSFQEANDQAQSECFAFLGVTESFTTDFDNLDISQDDEYNAVLLAFSIILQRWTGMMSEQATVTAELTQLLANLSNDFANNGEVSNQALIDVLLANISTINLLTIRNNVEARYAALGQTVSIPNFEKYISKFQEKHSEDLVTDFIYPEFASPDPAFAPDSEVPNLLVKSDTVFIAGAYTLAAIIPLNTNLTIKFIGSNNNNNYSFGGIRTGWEFINNYPTDFTINSQRQNELMSMLIHLENPGQAIIEYYENTSDSPSFTKTIRWETPK